MATTPSPKGNLDLFRAHFRGYDASARVFLLDMHRQSQAAAAPAKRREIGDFQALDRAIASSHRACDDTSSRPPTAAVPRLSLRRLKKLTEHSWQKGDASAGWRRELQKNVAACEQWLEQALVAAEMPVRSRFVDDDAYAAHHRARAETQKKNQRAKQLQQYFTSASLLEHVVSRLRAALGELPLPSIDSDRVVWLEPSCGDGRVVEALITAGAKCVIGCEFDERMCAVARDKLKDIKVATIDHGDFLVSTPPPVQDGTIIMAFGNPPFGDDKSTNATGTSGDCDLVAKFVVHTAHVWRAQLVAFIVPARCAKEQYLETLLVDLNGKDKQENEPAEGNGRAWSILDCEPLDDCTFEFQETKRVKQPSAFVVFTKRSPST